MTSANQITPNVCAVPRPLLNQVELEGEAVDVPEWSHENHGLSFYRFYLRVPRLSGQTDTLPVLLTEPEQVQPGDRLRIEGELRSFNNRAGTGRRLVLSVYARQLSSGTGEPCNRITLRGALCRPPVFRRTPLGRSICDLMIAVPRRCGRADYLPVIAWGKLACRTSELCVGSCLTMEGRIQSRLYHKATPEGVRERTAYEVSMMRLME